VKCVSIVSWPASDDVVIGGQGDSPFKLVPLNCVDYY